MNVETLRRYCLSKPGTTEDFPFDEETLVFRVQGKIFCLVSLEKIPLQFNLKRDPIRAIELREAFDAVRPGYHMNKKHWNTVVMDGSVPSREIREMIDHSYTLIFESLPKRLRDELNAELRSSRH
ncbi:MAG: MmcQ/YjbR family DNA-binding protein [Bacteroidota bacterium]|jgi:predicted DNA-binding protein (MmcQ/YjbR family)